MNSNINLSVKKDKPLRKLTSKNRTDKRYGMMFRHGEDRLKEQVEGESWFLGYIMNKTIFHDGHVCYKVDWWYNYGHPTTDHGLYYEPSFFRDDDKIVKSDYFQDLIKKYDIARSAQPEGDIAVPDWLQEARMSDKGLNGEDTFPWVEGVDGFKEYKIYEEEVLKHGKREVLSEETEASKKQASLSEPKDV